jgi:hypothetical protein
MKCTRATAMMINDDLGPPHSEVFSRLATSAASRQPQLSKIMMRSCLEVSLIAQARVCRCAFIDRAVPGRLIDCKRRYPLMGHVRECHCSNLMHRTTLSEMRNSPAATDGGTIPLSREYSRMRFVEVAATIRQAQAQLPKST